MSKVPWQEAAPHEFNRLREDVQQTFPELRVFEEKRLVHVAGIFRIFHHGIQLARYHIHVLLPPNHPHVEPIVFETKGEIPRDIDNHIGSAGQLCLYVPGERHLHWPIGRSITDFLNGPVQSFFVSYLTYTETGKWPFGQRSHNKEGIVQAYAELLGNEDELQIEKYLSVLSSSEVKGHWLCPCLSGKTIRGCHKKEIQGLRQKISVPEARHAYKVFSQPKMQGIENASSASGSLEAELARTNL